MMINLKEIFQTAFILYKKSFSLLLSLGLIFALVNETAQMIFQKLLLESPGMLIILNMFVSAVVSMALVRTALHIYQGKEVDMNIAFSKVKERYLSYVAVSISFFVVVMSGVLFLIIPGAYFGTIFIFADLLVVAEDQKYMDAFKRSAELVRGYFWSVLFFSMMLAVLLVVPALTFGGFQGNETNFGRVIHMCLMVFIVPYITMAQIGLYLRMKEIQENNHV